MNYLDRAFHFFQASIFIFALPFSSVSQQDLNNYQTLLCRGEMPFDFKASVSEKVAKELESSGPSFRSKTEALEFWSETHTELEEVLRSGQVIYGDEISTYVQQVAANLLKDDPGLLKKLRFYTVKSNQVNAFSTAPGIIFVTTGLISQLVSEAQLAFILSHEIAHFEKNHVYLEYLNRKKSGTIKKRDRILKLTQFSKDLEFEADEAAISRYHRLGYSSEELLGTFDILMYSYLPFDEITFPNDHFNTEHLFIPEQRIEREIKAITAKEDYNDNYHTHPNIKKRKEAILNLLKAYSAWGETRFMLDEQVFHNAVTTCRFEDVRINLVEGNTFNALYSIFLLERLYPGNTYLQRAKAASWLAILQSGNVIHKRFENPKIEGESSKLYKFLKASKKVELSTIGLRIVYDLKIKYPDDPFIVNIYNNYVWELSSKSYFDLSKFQEINYHQAAEASISKANEQQNPVKDTVENPNATKYSRIKEKRTVSTIIHFDSTDYAIYALPDIIRDSLFLSDFKYYKAYHDSIDSALKTFSLLSPKEQTRAKNEQLKKQSLLTPAFKEILVIEPEATIFSEKTVPNWEIERAEKNFMTMVRTLCSKNGFIPVLMKIDSVVKQGTDAFNEYAIYIAYFEQMQYTNLGKTSQPIDFALISNYNRTRGISHILSAKVHYLKDYQRLNMQSLLINLENGEALLEDTQKAKILSPENYTPFFSDFFIAIRRF